MYLDQIDKEMVAAFNGWIILVVEVLPRNSLKNTEGGSAVNTERRKCRILSPEQRFTTYSMKTQTHKKRRRVGLYTYGA